MSSRSCVHDSKNVSCANSSCYCVNIGKKCTNSCSCSSSCCKNRRKPSKPRAKKKKKERVCGICKESGHNASNKKYHPDGPEPEMLSEDVSERSERASEQDSNDGKEGRTYHQQEVVARDVVEEKKPMKRRKAIDELADLIMNKK